MAAWLRRHGPAIVVFCLFLAGIIVLYRTLNGVDIHQIRQQFHTMTWRQIGPAALCAAAGYIALVGYDWSALRYIRRRLPMPLIAFTSFVGYALSNTIGVSWLSGGAVRYRIYFRAGLNATEIALITGFCTLGFGIGEVLVGGGRWCCSLICSPNISAGRPNGCVGGGVGARRIHCQPDSSQPTRGHPEVA